MINHLWMLMLSLAIVLKSKAQEATPGKMTATLIQVRNDDNNRNKPVKRPCLLWLPSGYSDSSNTPFYPLLVFLFGAKQVASLNTTNLDTLKKNGPLYFLQ